MKKIFKVLVLMIVCTMLIGLFAACGSEDAYKKGGEEGTTKSGAAKDKGSDSNGSSESTEKELPFVKLKMYMVGDEPDDMEMVWTEINKMTKVKINTEIEPVVLPLGEKEQKYPMLLASGEQFDLIFIAKWCFLDAITDNAFVPLDDYLPEYGPNLLEKIPQMGWNVGSYNGKKYMVPKVDVNFDTEGLVIREDLRKKYNAPKPVDYASILQYFKAIKENEPEMIPLNATAYDELFSTVFALPNDIQTLTEFKRVLAVDMINPTEILSITEMEEFKEYLNFARECYNQGYWSKSVLSNKITSKESFENGRGAATTYTPTAASTAIPKVESSIDGAEAKYYSLEGNSKVTRTGYKAGYAIYHASDNPERAVKFLDLVHSDQELYNLVYYGIEGEHYVLTDDGKRMIPEGKTKSDIKYSDTYSIWGLYDGLLEIPVADQWDQLEELKADFQKNAIDDKRIGFKIVNDSISTEVAALMNVFDIYFLPLKWGVVDPEEGLETLKDNMNKAGIEKVIEEVQKQLDDYNASRK